MRARKIKRWFGGGLGILLVLTAIILLNVILTPLRWRRDFTAEQLYTLAPGTRTMLSALERPVTLRFYFSRSNERVPIPLQHYAQRLVDLLREYETLARGRVTLEIIDPRPDTPEEEWAQRYGLEPRGLGGFGAEGEMYLGLVALSGRREAALPFISPGMEPQIEYLVTQLIHEVLREARPVIGILSPLQVVGAPAMPYPGAPPAERGWAFTEQLQRHYEVRPVSFDTTDIPAGIDLLLVIHPADIEDDTLRAIDRYMQDGGRLLAFLDPLSLADRERLEAGHPMMMPGGSDLNPLTAAWGVRLEEGLIVADPRAATQVAVSRDRAESIPTWLTLREDALARDEIATGSLNMLQMPFGGVFRKDPVDGLTYRTLLRSSDESTGLPTYAALMPGMMGQHDGQPLGAVTLAVWLQGRFPPAFPEEPESEADGPGPAAGSGQPGAAALIADADMLYDAFALREMRFMGQSFMEPLNDNLVFALNLVEQLTGSEALIGLRSRRAMDRPFHRVLELERQAQERWQREEEQLLEELQRTQRRLDELQRAESTDQGVIITPEQQRAIEEFRTRRFETQRRLTEVRRNLRADIERLGLRLKVINMGAMPALVAVWGIVHAWRRKRSMRRAA